MAERQQKHEHWMEKAPLYVPFRLTQRAQTCALTAVVVLAILAGFVASKGATGKALIIAIATAGTIVVSFLGGGKADEERSPAKKDPSARRRSSRRR